MDSAPISYSTSIPVTKTTGEIVAMLARAGAQRVATSFDQDGVADGLSFALHTEVFGVRIFQLPVDIDQMHRRMTSLSRARKLNISRALAESREQAARVAWRVVRTWLASQLSLIDTGMFTLEQTFFAHLKSGGFDSPTLFELASTQPGLLAIEAP